MNNPLTAQRIERDAKLWGDMTIAQGAWQKAQERPDEVAIYLEGEAPITYGSIADEARRLVTGLQGLGLRQGDVISFQLPNWREGAVIDAAPHRSELPAVYNRYVPVRAPATISKTTA